MVIAVNVECISEALGIQEPQTLEPLVVIDPRDENARLKKIKRETFEKDQSFARDNLIQIIEYAMEIVPSAVEVARETETPRQLEAVAGFLKTVAEINKDLIDVSRKALESQEITDRDSPTTVVNNQTAIFTGSTEDLISRLFPRKDN